MPAVPNPYRISSCPNDSAKPIEHPLVPVFFAGFSDGGYERNDQPWPGA